MKIILLTVSLVIINAVKVEAITIDRDSDGLSDQVEVLIGTDINNPDTDGDGYYDSIEYEHNFDPLDVNSPGDESTFSSSEGGIESAWYVSRISALTAFVLMSVIVVSGLLMTTNLADKILRFIKFTRGDWFHIHKILAVINLGVIVVHIISLLFDKYMNPSLADLFIPFYIDDSTFLTSLGIFAFYFFLIVFITSYFLKLKKKVWRSIHYLTFAVYWLTIIHGFFYGSDTSSPLVLKLYIISATTVSALITYRIYLKFHK